MPDNIFFTETLFERRNNIVWGLIPIRKHIVLKWKLWVRKKIIINTRVCYYKNKIYNYSFLFFNNKFLSCSYLVKLYLHINLCRIVFM